jgi:general stress protein 26
MMTVHKWNSRQVKTHNNFSYQIDQQRVDDISENRTGSISKLILPGSVCVFTTAPTEIPLQARLMNTQYVDKEDALWFFSSKDSNKNAAIRSDARVQLFYTNAGHNDFLNIYGQAQILFDREKIDEFWTPAARLWFKGKDDPQISLIKVAPDNFSYWHAKKSKMEIVHISESPTIVGNEKIPALKRDKSLI